MPVTNTLTPKNQKELNQKIIGKPNDPLIPGYVKSHLETSGPAIYTYSVDVEKDVLLTAKKCIVFLIGGKFKVGGEEATIRGVGHLVENEDRIQLQPYTIVVIINQD